MPERGPGRGRGLHLPHHLGPRGEPGVGAHPRPPRHRGRASPPDPRGQAGEGRPHHRDGRAPRGPPHGPAPGLRGGGHQPLSRLRDARRHDRPAHLARARSQDGGEELHQGPEQGRAQGHLEDGHLHHPVVPGGPDLRGHRPRQGLRGPLLHLDGLADRRDRPGRGGARDPPPPPARLPRAAHRRARAGLGRRVPVAAGRGVPPLQPRHRLQAAACHPREAVRDLQGVHDSCQHPERSPGHAAGSFHLQG